MQHPLTSELRIKHNEWSLSGWIKISFWKKGEPFHFMKNEGTKSSSVPPQKADMFVVNVDISDHKNQFFLYSLIM